MNENYYMSDEQAKASIVDIGSRMYLRNFVAANDGNISIKTGNNHLWITPSGVSKGYLTQEQLIKIDLSGNILEGNNKYSSEAKMHLQAYKENPDIKAVCHAHPTAATSFAIAGLSMDLAIMPEVVITLGEVPVLPYVIPGSDEVGEGMAIYFNTHNAVLLGNHGVTTWGDDIYQAFYRMETLEHYAQTLLNTNFILGKVNPFTKQEISELLDLRKKMGIKRGGIPKGMEEMNEKYKKS